ncbi:MAG TPA: zf-HC2 domain-containing protein [Acidobacteriota bacterium]|jgi:predicted anti-sigma-YlaC factor YlaD|nr:zf-HC2 domain-containing protein [Acidobacteriota bacterium]
MKDFFKCQECVDLLTDYLDGNLEVEVKDRLDEHLSGCAPCINFVRTFETSQDLTHRLREQKVNVPREVQERLKSFLKEEIVALSLEKPK